MEWWDSGMKLTLEYIINALHYADTYENSIGTINKSIGDHYANVLAGQTASRRMVQQMTCKHGNLVLESDDCLLCSREVIS